MSRPLCVGWRRPARGCWRIVGSIVVPIRTKESIAMDLFDPTIVWYHKETGETQLWFMNGEHLVRRGTVLDETGAPIFIGPPFAIVGTSDMDGNGKSDIVWYNDQ